MKSDSLKNRVFTSSKIQCTPIDRSLLLAIYSKAENLLEVDLDRLIVMPYPDEPTYMYAMTMRQ